MLVSDAAKRMSQICLVFIICSSDKVIIIDQSDCFGIPQQKFAVIKSSLRFEAYALWSCPLKLLISRTLQPPIPAKYMLLHAG